MIGDGILPDDLVIVKSQPTAEHGQLVAALLGDNATVKRLNKKATGVSKLMPSNPNYEPILLNREDASIIGRVVGLIRDYDTVH